MRPFRAAVAAMLVCALAAPASGAPAVVRVFEAQAHEQPHADSPVLHVFPEEAKLSVSEQATDGWRRVRLPDGRTGFVRDEQLAVGAPPPVQPLPGSDPPPARPQAVDLPLLVHVRNMDHLSSLTQGDAVVGPQASALVTRRTAAIGIMVGALAAGVALGIAGVALLSHEECLDPPRNSACSRRPNFAAVVGGILLGVSGPLTWLLVKPTRADVQEVIDTWNARHRDQLFLYAR
jgi:hypothetical protein